jgi:hypothetical protein
MTGSESFHFTTAGPERQVILRGEPGVLRITNAGPARILVRNDKNELTLGAGSRLETDHAGETVIALDPSDPSGHASGTWASQRIQRT